MIDSNDHFFAFSMINAFQGICMHPNECWCKGGWQGVDCSECIPYWACVNGFCEEPHECKCFEGFIGKILF